MVGTRTANLPIMLDKVSYNKIVLFKMPTEPLLRNIRMQKGEQIYVYPKLNTSTKFWHLFHITCRENMYYRNSERRNNGEDVLPCVLSLIARKYGRGRCFRTKNSHLPGYIQLNTLENEVGIDYEDPYLLQIPHRKRKIFCSKYDSI